MGPAVFLIVKDSNGEIPTEAYFEYNLQEAMKKRDELVKETQSTWYITVVVN